MLSRYADADDHSRALSTIQKYSGNPSAFLALNQGNLCFRSPGIDGGIFYRPAGRSWIQFGGPFASPGERTPLLTRFLASAREENRRVFAVQLMYDDAKLYADAGLAVNQIGKSYALQLDDFSLKGKHFVRLRNKISRARRAGLVVTEVDPDEYEAAIRRIDAIWLRSKGRLAKPLRFIVGEIGGPHQHLRRLFLGTIAGKTVGYISYSPVYGLRPGWLHDLSRRDPAAPPGIMEAINLAAIDSFRQSGADWLHFGITPFLNLEDSDTMSTKSRTLELMVKTLANHGEKVYPAKSQLEYKMKWSPSLTMTEYAAYSGRLSFTLAFNFLRAINRV